MIVAVLVPVAAGLKVTEMVQDPPAGILGTQLFVWANSLGSVPAKVILVTLRAVLPALVMVTVLALLVVPTICAANVNDVGVIATAVPVPAIRLACCPWPAVKVPKIFNAAVSPPVCSGVNVTFMVHVCPAGRLLPQVPA